MNTQSTSRTYTPLFVPAAPGSVLQKRIQEETIEHIRRLGMKVTVIEMVGRKIGSLLDTYDLTGFRLQGGLKHQGRGLTHQVRGHLSGVREEGRGDWQVRVLPNHQGSQELLSLILIMIFFFRLNSLS